MSYAVILTVAILNNGFDTAIPEIIQLYSGQFNALQNINTHITAILIDICTVVSISAPMALAINKCFPKINTKNHEVSCFLKQKKVGHFDTVGYVIIEELYARWLFLGCLWSFYPSPGLFYVLFIIGNGTWTLMHLWNYKKKEDRKIYRVLPIFITGIFISYIFMKHGIVAAILCHLLQNGILYAASKKEVIAKRLIIDSLVSLGTLIILSTIITKPLSDIAEWFNNNGNYALSGWSYWDYLLLTMALAIANQLFFTILGYDTNTKNIDKAIDKHIYSENIFNATLTMTTTMLVMMILIHIVYAISHQILQNPIQSILTTGLIYTCIGNSNSGSSAMRAVYRNILMTFLIICLTEAIGIFSALSIMLIGTIISTILHYFIRNNEEKVYTAPA